MQMTAKIGTRISQYNTDDCCAKVVYAIPAKLSRSIAKNGSSRPKIANRRGGRGAGEGSDCGALKGVLFGPPKRYIAIPDQGEANLASAPTARRRRDQTRSSTAAIPAFLTSRSGKILSRQHRAASCRQ